jgi:hypothetical protein
MERFALLTFILAAPLIVTNNSDMSLHFVVRQTTPKTSRVVTARLPVGDSVATKWQSTPKTKHRVEARNDKGKLIACAMVTNASEVELVVTPDQRFHFVCTAGDKTKATVQCGISGCK